MGRIRGWVKRLERAIRGSPPAELRMAHYYFDTVLTPLSPRGVTTGSAHNWPPAPEIMHKVCEARDPEVALAQVMESAAFSSLVYDPEVIITERRLESRGLVSRYDPVLGEHVVGDQHDEGEPEDLSKP